MRTAYLETLCELADKDQSVFALLADNGIIVYDEYRKRFPKQYLNLGISESHMVAVAAGMANQGKTPFAYTIGVFLAFRAFEFIRNDVCLQNQNVKLVGIGVGMAYSALGSTHHATEDLGGLRGLPNLQIITPASPLEVRKATFAAYEHEGPVYLRLGTNREPEIYKDDYDFQIGKSVVLREGRDIAIIAMGSILNDVLSASKDLEKEGISARVINMHTVKPLDHEAIHKAVDEIGRIITIEDHNIVGGLGSAVAEAIAEYDGKAAFRRIGLKDFSKGYGSYGEVKEMNGVGILTLKKEVKKMLMCT